MLKLVQYKSITIIILLFLTIVSSTIMCLWGIIPLELVYKLVLTCILLICVFTLPIIPTLPTKSVIRYNTHTTLCDFLICIFISWLGFLVAHIWGILPTDVSWKMFKTLCLFTFISCVITPKTDYYEDVL